MGLGQGAGAAPARLSGGGSGSSSGGSQTGISFLDMSYIASTRECSRACVTPWWRPEAAARVCTHQASELLFPSAACFSSCSSSSGPAIRGPQNLC